MRTGQGSPAEAEADRAIIAGAFVRGGEGCGCSGLLVAGAAGAAVMIAAAMVAGWYALLWLLIPVLVALLLGAAASGPDLRHKDPVNCRTLRELAERPDAIRDAVFEPPGDHSRTGMVAVRFTDGTEERFVGTSAEDVAGALARLGVAVIPPPTRW
jgi:hypothetical protein